ncbi:galactose-specific lectin nattectin-like [Patiria miniata]|uniref:C-type lectin domain-containing protein n=1 Tax=Patiria miniata TaxID=46514 RepID=A0A913ZU67_PATMI|nr:galactose-specific lectin nattectin-like [Patiria miniata]
MIVSKRFIFGLINLHLMMGCTGGNEMCKASFRGTWACQPSWSQWGGKCYKAITAHLPWAEAKEECVKMGSIMVVPQSQEETDFLVGLLPTRFWINCNDLGQEGTWRCEDGIDEVEFRNWESQQPDNWAGIEHCAEVRHAYIGNGMTCRVITNALPYAKLQSPCTTACAS